MGGALATTLRRRLLSRGSALADMVGVCVVVIVVVGVVNLVIVLVVVMVTVMVGKSGWVLSSSSSSFGDFAMGIGETAGGGTIVVT